MNETCHEKEQRGIREKREMERDRERERERDVDEFLCTAYLMSLELPFFREFK